MTKNTGSLQPALIYFGLPTENINFIKNIFSNPTPPGDEFTWTPASKENKECLVISDQLQMKSNLHEDKVQFWDNFLAKHDEMAVNGILTDSKDEL